MLDKQELTERCKKIRLLLLDVDGVLTEGRLLYAEDRGEIKSFNTLDGHGIKMLQASGVEVGIISGRSGEPLQRRARGLGIKRLIQGREDKFVALQEMLQDQPFPLEAIAFMGDDWPDLSIMTKVGVALSVPNAHSEVLNRAHWVSQSNGGLGAVREACDLIMKAQNTYTAALAKYIG